MIIALFEIKDKKNKCEFFKEIFLLANLSIYMVLEILFLILNNIKINFQELELYWKISTIIQVVNLANSDLYIHLC